jgi:cell division protein FtsW (lipid II flippase)
MRSQPTPWRRRWRNVIVVLVAAVLMMVGSSRMPSEIWGDVWIAGVVVIALLVMYIADRLESHQDPKE